MYTGQKTGHNYLTMVSFATEEWRQCNGICMYGPYLATLAQHEPDIFFSFQIAVYKIRTCYLLLHRIAMSILESLEVSLKDTPRYRQLPLQEL